MILKDEFASDVTISELKEIASPEIIQLVDLGFNVGRFSEPSYPIDLYKTIDGQYRDNVATHIIRCIRIARKLENQLPNGVNIDTIIQTILIHDLPEIIDCQEGADMTSVTKVVDPSAALAQSHKEQLVANQILDTTKLDLYKDFELAGFALKGQGNLFTNEAFIAYLIDKIEGNITFHILLSQYTQRNKRQPIAILPLPRYEALVHTFNQYQKYISRLTSLGISPECKALAEKILEAEILTIKQIWQGLEIPNDIFKNMSNI